MEKIEPNDEKKSDVLEYNHALFENMAYFSDAVLEMNCDLNRVAVIYDTIVPEWEGMQFTIDEFRESLRPLSTSEYFKSANVVVDREFIRNLKKSERFENCCLVGKKYHRLQCVVTPVLNGNEPVSVAYITVRDVQDIYDEKEDDFKEIEADYEKIRGILSATEIGLWSILALDDTKKFFVDDTTAKIVGITEKLTPEEVYDFWFERIDKEYVSAVLDCMERMKRGIASEVIYPYHHPKLGTISIRCGGAFDRKYTGEGVRFRGYHQNISDFNEELLRKLEISTAMQKHFFAVLDANLSEEKCHVLWDPKKLFSTTINDDGVMDLDFSPYFYHFSSDSIRECKERLSPKGISAGLKERNVVCFEVEAVEEGWYRISFISSLSDEQGNVVKCIILMENIDEVKKEEIEQRKALEEALEKERKDRAALVSIAGVYDAMHVLDLKEGTIDELSATEVVHNIMQMHLHEELQQVIWSVMKERISGEYIEQMLRFTDFSTIKLRLRNRKSIFLEVVNVEDKWLRFGLIKIDDGGGDFSKVIFVSQNVDEIKREQEMLFEKSTKDELTHLLNRNAYEEDMAELENAGFGSDLWYLAFDINNLKVTNDTKGHAAGDELLVGFSDCLLKAASDIGKSYRIGGDEFACIIKGSAKEVHKVVNSLKELQENWKGEYSEEFSFSKGIVSSAEFAKPTLTEILKESDRRMYAEKKAWHNRISSD